VRPGSTSECIVADPEVIYLDVSPLADLPATRWIRGATDIRSYRSVEYTVVFAAAVVPD
jgi:hypothetical protein